MAIRRLRLVLLAVLAFAARPSGELTGQGPRPADKPAPAAGVDLHGDPLPAGARARLGTLRFRVADHVNAAALSPDGKVLAISGQGITLLDAVTGKEVRRLVNGYVGANALIFSPDGKALAGVNGAGRVQLWDIRNGNSLGEFQAQGPQSRLISLTFSGDGKALAAGNEVFGQQQAIVHVWEIAGRKQLARVEAVQNYRVLTALSGDGKVLATWGTYINRNGGMHNPEPAQTIQLWDVASGKELRRVRVEHNAVATAALSPDGKTLAATTGGSTVYLWDATTGKEQRRFAGRRGLGAYLGFSRDGKVLAAAGYDGTVQLWAASTGRRLGLCEPPQCRFNGLGFLADGRALAWGVEGQTVCLWDVPSGKSATPLVAHANRVTSLVFRAGGKELLTTSLDGKVFTWDTATGKTVREGQVRDNDGSRNPYGGYTSYGGPAASRYQSLVLSPDGKHAAGGSGYNSTMRLWDVATGRAVCDFEGGRSDSQALTFSPDSSLLAVANFDRSVRLWDVHTGQQLRQVKFQKGEARAMAFSPNGKALAVARNDYEPNTGHQITEIDVIETDTGRAICSIKRMNAYLNAVTFSPDGRVLATAGQTPAVDLWDAATGKELRRLEGQAGGVFCLAFSPDGRTLAAGAQQYGRAGAAATSGVTVWELATGQVRVQYAGHIGLVTALAYAPDCRTLASGSSDTSIVLWDLAGDAAQATAKELPEQEVTALWGDLAGADAQRAHAAVRKLRAAPAQALALFRKHLRPAQASTVTAGQIGKLIAQMNDRRFPVRNRAQKALEDLSVVALVPLRAALKEPLASEEQRRRIGTILQKVEKISLAPEELRGARAVETLEYIATAEARQFLTELAGGAPVAGLTREARGVLRRLDLRAR